VAGVDVVVGLVPAGNVVLDGNVVLEGGAAW
jgi:hypothetical protein